ncbi:OLC1v1010597C1 [Oldenlandia corymbosa var. corymbosa]|uniref:OLC1v1010597C1 n=1 Tax=Oldenlandia corymbosa var. corymbosa TaxID=529605 RepID=A0AAV1DV36_OLDCO|nr:OLC1v1010597C1 [Oldenlandia corymbosa var. corymbosa]
MRQRSLSGKENLSFTAPRRSSRISQENQPKSEAPNTPKCVLRKNRVPLSDLTPVSSFTDADSVKKSQKLQSAQCSINSKSSKKSSNGSGKSTRSSYRSEVRGLPSVRRSARLSKTSVRRSAMLSQKSAEKTDLAGSVEVFASAGPKEMCSSNGANMVVVVNLRDRSSSVTEKRVKRSSKKVDDSGVRADPGKGCKTLRKCNSVGDRDAANISDRGQAGRDANFSVVYKIEKRVTRSASREIQDVRSSESGDFRDSSDDGKARLDGISSGDPNDRNKDMRACVPSADVVGGRDGIGSLEAEKEETGAKRKKVQVREELVTVEDGWTMEQELALERAYFAAKPTPHFWKKVSKMVPGKSAKECFDKIHSELMTPPPPRTRSRTVTSKSPLPSVSELLNSSVLETKKRKYNKPKSHLAHKKVRQLLIRQCNIDEDNDADLFSVLEQTFDHPTQVVQDDEQLLTPERHVEESCFGERWVEESLASASGKQLSRLSNSSKAAVLTSPPVLKKVKNKVLHEKYIDQLHSREARRKAASLRAAKSNKGGTCAKENRVQKMEAVKDAKNALIFCAKDAIDQFHHLQGNTLNDFDNTFDYSTASSEHESEDDS